MFARHREQAAEQRDAVGERVLRHRLVRGAPAPAVRVGAMAFREPRHRLVERARHRSAAARVLRPAPGAAAGKRAAHRRRAASSVAPPEGGEVAADRLLRERAIPRLEDQRLGAVGIHAPVPRREPRRVRRAGDRGQHQRQELARHERHDVGLQCLEVGNSVPFLRRQPVGDAPCAVVLGPVARDEMAVVGRRNVLVGGDDDSAGRVAQPRQFLIGDEAGPVAAPVRRRDRQPAVVAAADGHAAGSNEADLAPRVGQHEVLHRPVIALERREQRLHRLRLREAETGFHGGIGVGERGP